MPHLISPSPSRERKIKKENRANMCFPIHPAWRIDELTVALKDEDGNFVVFKASGLTAALAKKFMRRKGKRGAGYLGPLFCFEWLVC